MFIRQYGHQLRIDTPAKVNFFLELHGRHLIPSEGRDIRLSCQLQQPAGQPGEQDPIPTDGRNLVVRACERLRDYALERQIDSPLSLGLNIHLTKWIPSAAGLGGASSDCAAALVGANRAWKLGLNQTQLHSIATELGSDVPFFLHGGACRCTGRGEIIQSVAAPAGVNLVIVKPPVALSTKQVFGHINSRSSNSPTSSDTAVQAVATGRVQQIADSLFNRLTQPAAELTDQMERVAGQFERAGSLGHQMSGSGSSYFGIFPNRKSARAARQQLANQLTDCRVFAVRTLAASEIAKDQPPVANQNVSPTHEGASQWK